MQSIPRSGFFGKLLSRGDFVSRGLPPALVSQWDDWLQQSMGYSQQQLGSQWRDIYLTSPLWHFFLRPGCLDTQGWTGLLMPSIDRVGRHYPLLIAAPLQGPSVTLEVCQQGWRSWHRTAEQLARQSLQGQLTPEVLEDSLNLQALPTLSLSPAEGMLSRALHLPDHAQLTLQNLSATTSFWWTSGSPRISPCILACNGLPAPEHFQALLSGDWHGWESA